MTHTSFDQYNVTVKHGNKPVSPYDDLAFAPSVCGGSVEVSFALKLHTGSYAVTVDAYKNGIKAATATKPLIVKSSGASVCDLTLQPILNSGTGTLAWRFLLPSDATGTLALSDAAGPIDIAPNDKADSLTLHGTGAEIHDLITAPAGIHNLRLTLTDNSNNIEVIPLDELCSIYAGLTTQIRKDYAAYTFKDKPTVSGTVFIDNPTKVATGAIVVTAYHEDGTPFEPAITRSFANPDYKSVEDGAMYEQPYTLALPTGAVGTRPIIRASFAESSDDYYVDSSGASTPVAAAYYLDSTHAEARPSVALANGVGTTGVDPILRLSTATIPVSGKIIVDNPAHINFGNVTVSATGTFAQNTATLLPSDNSVTYTYDYKLELPPGALGTQPALGVTFSEYLPKSPDGLVQNPPKKTLTTDGINNADFHVCLYGLTSSILQAQDKTNLTTYVDNRARNVVTDTIYLWGNDFTSDDLATLGKAIGNKRLRLDMTHSFITDGAIPKDAFAACESLESISIPGSVRTIPEGSFAGCNSLASITVDKNSPYYKTYDGALYTADETTLIAYAPANNSDSFIIPNRVTTIANSAFRNCKNLTSIALTSTIRTVGDDAFNGCSALRSLTVANGLQSIGERAFAGCNLTSVALPHSTVTLGPGCFENNPNLETFTYSTDLDTIPERAFANCGLKNFTVNNAVKRINKEAFVNNHNLATLTMNNRLETIDDNAFRNCAITSLDFPNTLVSIGNEAFLGCVRQKGPNGNHINLGSGVKKIGDRVWTESIISSIDIPSSVRTIGAEVFKNCTKLSHVNLNEGIESIGDGAFYGCHNLKQTFVAPASLSSIGAGALEGCKIGGIDLGKSGLTAIPDRLCYGVTQINGDVVIPGSARYIGDGAFYGCNGIDKVVIPGSVATIGIEAFRNCDDLTDITLGSGIQTIKQGAFRNCGTDGGSRFTDLDIPGSVKTIGPEAFADCVHLCDLAIGIGVETIGEHAFLNCCGHGLKYSEDVRGQSNAISKWWNDDPLVPWYVPSTVKTMGEGVFAGCKYLPEVNIVDGVIKAIPSEAFKDCENMENIHISASVTSIGDEAFSGCNDLEAVTLPYGVETVGELAFAECESLKSVKLPESIKAFGNRAFLNDNIDQVLIGKSLPTTGLPNRFDNYYTNHDKRAGRYLFRNAEWLYEALPDDDTL
jgi:hypothetical protein